MKEQAERISQTNTKRRREKMNKTKKALQLLLVLALTVLCFAACGTRTHTVTFHTGGDASITQLVADGKSV